MALVFDTQSDLYIELAEELLTFLQVKSKWATGYWTWVSLSNLKIHYDGKLVAYYGGIALPEGLNVDIILDYLVTIRLIERNKDILLKDQFYRMTPLGRKISSSGTDATYWYLSGS